MVLGGWGLRWLILQGASPPLTPVSGVVVWRLLGAVALGLSSGLATLRFYPLARDEKFINDLGNGINQVAFLLVLPIIILLSWNEWFEMSQYLIGVGSILLSWPGITFAFAVIGEIIFRFSEKY